MSETKKQKPVKLIIVGESHVGKTSIIHQLMDKKFDEGTIQTIGRGEKNYKEFNFSNVKVILEIWDTAGQERFRTLNKIFIKDAKIIILVYDITEKKTFDEICNFWYKDIISQLDNIDKLIIGIVGNKSDLYQKQEVDLNDAKNYADSINAIFKETSVKDEECINELFEELAQKFLEVNKDYFNSENKENFVLQEDNNEKKKKNKLC